MVFNFVDAISFFDLSRQSNDLIDFLCARQTMAAQAVAWLALLLVLAVAAAFCMRNRAAPVAGAAPPTTATLAPSAARGAGP